MNDDIGSLFRELADLSPQERAQFCNRRSVSEELRAEVESLLEFDSPNPPFDDLIPLRVKDFLDAPEDLVEGSHCGPYRLVRLLGRGGAGEVYLAERDDGHIQQRVAIKLLSSGTRRRAFRHRFLRERQILASLQHPGIAHLLDVGETADGKPYLVMDYIDGEHIDVFADKLDLRGKLELFLRVCDAVSYAHRNMVMHRDLKPSNILVDASGSPVLLDFGIAKIQDDTGDRTRTVERFLTPDYASPEQVRGSMQTSATDIYSLGAVLYDLLTGHSPHAFPAGTPEAMDAVICSGEVAPATSLNSELPRDLDFILSKALRKEPEERYSSVEAMAGDVRALLEWRPVRARSGNAWYRTRKFARRYRVLVSAVLLTISGLAAGLYMANRERLKAEQRFQQLHQLSSKIFDLDRDIRKLPGSTEARHSLVKASVQYLEGLSSSARGDLDLAEEIGGAYRQVGKIQGVPTNPNLGEFANAEASLKKGAGFLDQVLASRPRNEVALLTAAGIAHDRMIIAESERRDADAHAQAAKAVGFLDRLQPASHLNELQRVDLATTLSNIGLNYMNEHRYDDAIRFAHRSYDVAANLPTGQGLVAANLSLIGNSLRCQGHLEEALESIHRALQIAEARVYPTESERALNLYSILLREARTLGQDGGVSLNRPKEAIAAYQRAVDLTDAAAARDPKDQVSRDRLASCAREMADLLNDVDPQKSLEAFDLAIRRLREVNNIRARRREASVLAESSYPLRGLHRLPEARERIAAAFKLLTDTKDYPAAKLDPESEVVVAIRAQADYESDAGDRHRAVELYQQVFKAMMASKPDPMGELMDANKVSMMYFYMAKVHRRAGDTAEAASLDARRAELWKHWDTRLPNNSYVQRQLAARSD